MHDTSTDEDSPTDDKPPTDTDDESTTETPTRSGPPRETAAERPTAEPTLSVTPTVALADRPLEIRLTGLDPGQRATVSAVFSDAGTRWRSEATFAADARGVVDLTERAPVAGDYAGVRPMGLVQLATEDAPADDDSDEHRLRLTARTDGALLAEATVTRRLRPPGVERVEPDPERDGVVGDLFVPAGDGLHPGVVTLHGSGGSPQVRFAKALAARGFASLALRYFGDPEPIPDCFAEVPVSYVGRAVDWLRDRDGVSSGEVGVLGASRGTELAFLTAARRDDIGAVVAYSPSAYVWPGRGPDGSNPPAWTVDGDPLPPVPHPEDEEPSPTETERGLRSRRIFEDLVERASDDELASAMLPVETVEADVLLVSGADDGVWPADRMAETLADRLRAAAAGEVTHSCYDDAGHHAAPPYLPTTDRTVTATDDGPDLVQGGTPAGVADAEARAWREVLDAFDAALGNDSGYRRA